MSKFFTSDWHLGSSYVLINGYRIFQDVQHMNSAIIKSANISANDKNDVIYHVGDFCNRKNDRGFECLDTKPEEYLKLITAKMILIKGNHDENNNVKTDCNYLVTDIGQFRNVTVSHYPSYFANTKEIITFKPRSIHICGHVHEQWKYNYDYKQKVLNINVGVDCWKNNIISEVNLSRYIQKILNEHKRKKLNNEPDQNRRDNFEYTS